MDQCREVPDQRARSVVVRQLAAASALCHRCVGQGQGCFDNAHREVAHRLPQRVGQQAQAHLVAL